MKLPQWAVSAVRPKLEEVFRGLLIPMTPEKAYHTTRTRHANTMRIRIVESEYMASNIASYGRQNGAKRQCIKLRQNN